MNWSKVPCICLLQHTDICYKDEKPSVCPSAFFPLTLIKQLLNGVISIRCSLCIYMYYVDIRTLVSQARPLVFFMWQWENLSHCHIKEFSHHHIKEKAVWIARLDPKLFQKNRHIPNNYNYMMRNMTEIFIQWPATATCHIRSYVHGSCLWCHHRHEKQSIVGFSLLKLSYQN